MRAIGIVRVSQTAGREGESFASPEEQRKRIESACERDGFDLIAVTDELWDMGADQVGGQVEIALVVIAMLAPGQWNDTENVITAAEGARDDVRRVAGALLAGD